MSLVTVTMMRLSVALRRDRSLSKNGQEMTRLLEFKKVISPFILRIVERSYGRMNVENVKLAEEPKSSSAKASDEYIKLEREFDKLTEAIKLSHSTRERKAMRARKKKIREQQNLLYYQMLYSGYIEYTQTVLGLSTPQALYKRLKKHKKK